VVISCGYINRLTARAPATGLTVIYILNSEYVKTVNTTKWDIIADVS